MKIPRSNSDSRWEQLIRRAQADVAPLADVPALLRALDQAQQSPVESWREEFAGLFSTGRAIPACLAGAVAAAVLTTWQVWTLWQALPWAQLLTIAVGGAL